MTTISALPASHSKSPDSDGQKNLSSESERQALPETLLAVREADKYGNRTITLPQPPAGESHDQPK